MRFGYFLSPGVTYEGMLNKFKQAGDLGIDLMILYVRPTGDVEAAKERLILFRDEVIRRL